MSNAQGERTTLEHIRLLVIGEMPPGSIKASQRKILASANPEELRIILGSARNASNLGMVACVSVVVAVRRDFAPDPEMANRLDAIFEEAEQLLEQSNSVNPPPNPEPSL